MKTLNFIETRGNDGVKKAHVSFSEAILSPSASFGGLYVPESIPNLGLEFLEGHINSSYKELSLDILKTLNIDIEDEDLKDVIELYSKYDDIENPVPVVKVNDDLFFSELYHGPTRAFKDMALQPFGGLLSKLAVKKGENYLIMVATSGDTGPATLESLKNKPNIKVVCLYPNGGTSDVQRMQMITEESNNIKVLAVKGNFDDTQNALKDLLKSEKFVNNLEQKNIKLSAANSVNFGRIIFQIIYHIHSYLELVRSGEIKLGEKVYHIVPSGNFGDALGGYYAKKMGLPVKKFLISSNENNVLSELIKTGIYSLNNKKFENTIAPAMDILISSNIERILADLFGQERTKELMDDLSKNNEYKLKPEELKVLQNEFEADYTTDTEIKGYIKQFFDAGYLMDTHTATCMKLYNNCEDKKVKKIVFSTAEWTKFAPNVLNSIQESNENYTDQEAIEEIESIAKVKVTNKITDLFKKDIFHKDVIEKNEIKDYIFKFLN